MRALLLALLLGAGFAPPQARAIARYSWAESRFDPCATSRLGDGWFGVTGQLRRELHRAAGTAGCVAPRLQVRFLAREFPLLYPRCARHFAAGDLAAFRHCWGNGRGR